MPQEIRVLKCFSCNKFQSDIVKKSKKWNCKVCGELQSVQKVYFIGTGPDCRVETQRLNMLESEETLDKNKSFPGTAQSEILKSHQGTNIRNLVLPRNQSGANGKKSEYFTENCVKFP
uniref:MRN complex-interacting protein N-terminal domain-containing protein n=1 Tax=Megaselia scalaris TaxID=36166 RepID=T1GDB0_MEGSC